MSENLHNSFENLSICSSCCSANLMMEDFLNRLQNLETEKDKLKLVEEKIKELNEKTSDQQLMIKQGINLQDVHSKLIEEKVKYLEEKYKSMEEIHNKIQIEKNQLEEQVNYLKNENKNIFDLNRDLIEENKIMKESMAEYFKEREIVKEDNNKIALFIPLPNKIDEVDNNITCCSNKCINSNLIDGTCISNNGYINVNDDGFVKYHVTTNSLCFNMCRIFSKYSFLDAKSYSYHYSFFYYEITMTKERTDLSCGADIGLYNSDKYYCITLSSFPNCAYTFTNGDVFGCGIVFPPKKEMNKKPYIFFTKNGNKIYKEKLLAKKGYCLRPAITLKYCSVQTNFGNDLNEKPFIYNYSEHEY